MILPSHISTTQKYSVGPLLRCMAATGAPATANWVAGLAVLTPLTLPASYAMKRVYWMNGGTITSTNVDMGIYSRDGSTLLFHTGSVAMVGANAIQYAAANLGLQAGEYYLAWTCDNTTSRAIAVAVTQAFGQSAGLVQITSGALPLPSTPVLASYAGQGVPLCGITSTASGF